MAAGLTAEDRVLLLRVILNLQLRLGGKGLNPNA